METTERYKLNKELAQMLKGGVIMDVTTPEQAKIAEAAGACAVMALERIPADIRAAGGVSRMSDPQMIKGIQNAVSIPVMAKCRIGHFAEAQILQAIEIDYIDESEVLSPADDVYHIDKRQFKVPFVCGAKDLGEALRRINEGASMIRTKGEPGTGDIVQAVRHMRKMNSQIAEIVSMRTDELYEAAKKLEVPYDLVQYVHENHRLPVVNFAAGGVATPADAALMKDLSEKGSYTVTENMRQFMSDFRGGFATEAQNEATIRKIFEDTGYLIDTHTGVAATVYNAYKAETGDQTKTVIASTASPYKFSHSVLEAIKGKSAVEGKDEFAVVDELSEVSGTPVPKAVEELRSAVIRHNTECDVDKMGETVKNILGIA